MTVATPGIPFFMDPTDTELMLKALRSLFLEYRDEAIQTRLEILARYRAIDITDLEQKIAEGAVVEHPGWEDLITVENLDARVEVIDTLLRSAPRFRSEQVNS